MFDLVADVENYPEFLPWCRALRIVSRERSGETEIVVADLLVGYRMFRESFRSKVRLDRPGLRIDTDYVRGPLREMRNLWKFEPHPWEGDAASGDRQGSVVHFAVSFSLRNPLLQRAAVAVFEDAFAVMSDAFVERAAVVYGKPRET